MIAISVLTFLIFLVLISFCLFAVIIGLPGTWLMILFAALLEWTDSWLLPGAQNPVFGWKFFLICVLLAGLGEALEFFAGLLGAKKFGASTQGMIGALVGGLAGAVFGVGIPIPIIGSIIGALVGTFAGALIGEMAATDLDANQVVKPATGATLGKILGILSKFPISFLVWMILISRLFYSAFMTGE